MSPLLVLEPDFVAPSPPPRATTSPPHAIGASPPAPLVDRPVWYDAGAWIRTHPLATRRTGAAMLAIAALTAAIALALQPASGSDGIDQAAPAVAIDPHLSRVATARLPLIDVYVDPTDGVVAQTLVHPTPAGPPLVFLVVGEWDGWYKVRVPVAPQGTVGWIRASDVDVAEHHVQVTIDLDRHLLVASEDGRETLRVPIAVGRRDHPVPGETFVAARLTLTNPSAGYGRYALTIAGYDNGPETLFRGKGLVAMHGADVPSDTGQTVTSGSVGLAPADLRTLFKIVPVGTPVSVIGADPTGPA